jgi:DNA-binding PadR family transcriptional regulator
LVYLQQEHVKRVTLTSTSYAVLGLLAIKPWTTYELAKQMDRSLRRFWPRAESRIYDEPPKLVAAGLARASKDLVGKRPRTTYSITDEGRNALGQWLDVEGAPPELEFEGLLKVFFGEHGDRQAMLTHLAAARRWSEERLTQDAAIVQGYLREGSPFPDRLPVIVLTGRFLSDFARLVGLWAEWAEDEVAAWPDDIAAAEANRPAMDEVASYRRPAGPPPAPPRVT